MENLNLNNFLYQSCDGLYDPNVEYDLQCGGYKRLLKMLADGIEPVTLQVLESLEGNQVTEGFSYNRYLLFLHPLLRTHIIKNWSMIKKLYDDDVHTH
jgi:hypothetical protein